MRTYTVCSPDRERGEVRLRFALHGDGGPASAWACRAAVGDRAAVRDVRRDLRRARGPPKDACYLGGYWRLGATEDDIAEQDEQD